MNAKIAMLGALALSLAFSGIVVSHDIPYVQAQPGKPNPTTSVGVTIPDFPGNCITRGVEGCIFEIWCGGIGNHPVLNLSWGGVCFGSETYDGWQNGNHDKLDSLGNPAGSTDAQHITAGATALLDITDAGFPGGIAATYCQNLNPHFVNPSGTNALSNDNLCGGNWTGPPEAGNPNIVCQSEHREGSLGCLLRAEPYVDLCDSITIGGGLTGEAPNGDPAGSNPGLGDQRLPGGTTTDTPAGSFTGSWADPAATVFTNGDSGNWAPDFEALVFVSAPANGNSVNDDIGIGLNVCGPTANGWGTSGTISHT